MKSHNKNFLKRGNIFLSRSRRFLGELLRDLQSFPEEQEALKKELRELSAFSNLISFNLFFDLDKDYENQEFFRGKEGNLLSLDISAASIEKFQKVLKNILDKHPERYTDQIFELLALSEELKKEVRVRAGTNLPKERLIEIKGGKGNFYRLKT